MDQKIKAGFKDRAKYPKIPSAVTSYTGSGHRKDAADGDQYFTQHIFPDRKRHIQYTNLRAGCHEGNL